MKNNIIKYLSFTYITVIFFGCNDDFLERYPLDQISSETFWTTEKDLENYNNHIYNVMRQDDDYPIMMSQSVGPGVRFREGIWWWDQMSDNLAATHNRAQMFYEVSTGKHNVQNGPRVGGYKGWDLIRRINFGLENYNKGGLQPEITAKYEAEVRLFRAWFIADKVWKFGDVQWIGKTLNIDSPELYASRDDRVFVMDKVLEDLDYAIENLPDAWGGTPGRVNKWVALAVKSRLCLFEGTWQKYHNVEGSDPDKWVNESLSASKMLMEQGGFSLWSTGNKWEDYRHTHWQHDHSNNPEVIYWRQYIPGLNGHFNSRLFWNYNGGATKSFVDDFLCEDGLPITLSDMYQGDEEIEMLFENRDPRLMQCVLDPRHKDTIQYTGFPILYSNDPENSYPRLTGMSGGRNKSNTGFHVVKHWEKDDEQAGRYNHDISPPTLRLGEVLLNYAEAKAELGSITQTDLDISINLLRDRVEMPHLNLNPPMDPRYADDGVSSLIIEIRRERRIELFIEGLRYHDLRRWGQGKYLGQPTLGMRFDETAEARYPGADVKITLVDGIPYIDVRKGTDYEPAFDPAKHYLWPLPTDVLSQNPELKQNPGW